MPEGELRLGGADVPPLAELEAAFLQLCAPGEHAVASGVVPDPDDRRGRGIAVVLHWDGHRVHYTATRSVLRYWLARRRADHAYAHRPRT